MNIGKAILLGTLFFGAKAVLKKQPGVSSASGSTPGKTNDPYTPEEIAELKKAFCIAEKNPHLKRLILTPREQYIYDELKKRKNNLQTFCECRNIAKQTETELKGLDDKKEVIRSEVESFLKAFNEKMRIFGIRFRDDRQKNVDFLINFNIVPVKRISYIKKLTFEDFKKRQTDTLNKGTDLWIFSKRIKNKNVYIKLTLGDVNNKVVCISFHD